MMNRRVISLGGWCGPALMLGKLGYRTEAFPMDFSRCTLDGIIHFINNGFADGFYPPGPPPYKPECVGIWVLFRGQHTAFAHFDLNSEKIKHGFERKIERWNRALDGELGPLNLFRTVTARNPREELDLIPTLEAALLKRCPTLDFRLSVVVHDQGLTETTLLEPMSDRTALWALEYTADESKTLFDRAHDGYERVVQTMVAHDDHPLFSSSSSCDVAPSCCWPPRPMEKPRRRDDGCIIEGNTADTFPWRSHDNIALIDGVASVAGTCTGIGSTAAVPVLAHAGDDDDDQRHKDEGDTISADADENDTHAKNNVDSSSVKFPFKCLFCGNADGHRANKPARSEKPFTPDEDEVLVAHLCKILVLGSDRVEAVESIAHELGRGSFEVVCRLQFLTNSSLKLTEGWADEKDDNVE